MQYLSETFSCFLLIFSSLINVMAQENTDEEEWIQLFNGKDLEDWDIKIGGYNVNENFKNTFDVEDGILKIAQNKKPGNKIIGHLYYKKPFSYYKIRFEYRFTGNQLEEESQWDVQYGGVMIHSQSARSMGKKQDYPVSLEVQLLGGLDTGERSTGNLCTIGTIVEMDGEINLAHCINSNSKTYDGDQWVKGEAIVMGDSLIAHLIEGDTVLSYQNPQIGGGFVSQDYDWIKGHVKNYNDWIKKEGTLLKEGNIALQADDPIEFRKVELLNLKGCTNPKCANYKSYYVVTGNCQCNN